MASLCSSGLASLARLCPPAGTPRRPPLLLQVLELLPRALLGVGEARAHQPVARLKLLRGRLTVVDEAEASGPPAT